MNLQESLSNFIERIWNNGNFSDLDQYVAQQYEIRSDPGDPWEGQTVDLATFQQRVLYSRNAFPDLRFAIQEMIADEKSVAATWIMSGTHTGDLPQLPATGRPFSIAGMTIYYFEGSKVSGHSQSFDRFGFLMQIGFFQQLAGRE